MHCILICEEEALRLVLFNAVRGAVGAAAEPSREFDAFREARLELCVENGRAIDSGADGELRLVNGCDELAVRGWAGILGSYTG